MKAKEKSTSKLFQNYRYKLENRRDKNKLDKLARYTAKNPTDSQAAKAYVNLYHEMNG